MVEMVGEVKLMRYKTGLQLVHVQRLMSFGIMVLKIYTELVLKEWLVLLLYTSISFCHYTHKFHE